MNISAARYRELLAAKTERDAVVDALGAAWLELHEWLSLATNHQRGSPNGGGEPWGLADGAVRDLAQTLAIITNTLRDLARHAAAERR